MPIVAPGPSVVQFNAVTSAPIRTTGSTAPSPARASIQAPKNITASGAVISASASVKGR